MGDSGCRKCGEDGHFARYNFSLRAFKMIHCVHFRDCPTGGGGGGGDDKCRNCRQEVRLAWRLLVYFIIALFKNTNTGAHGI